MIRASADSETITTSQSPSRICDRVRRRMRSLSSGGPDFIDSPSTTRIFMSGYRCLNSRAVCSTRWFGVVW